MFTYKTKKGGRQIQRENSRCGEGVLRGSEDTESAPERCVGGTQRTTRTRV